MTEIVAKYDIPTINFHVPARQNRFMTDGLELVPGFALPVRFSGMNRDGFPINMSGFRPWFVVWKTESPMPDGSGDNRSVVVLKKPLEVKDEHLGSMVLMLSGDETKELFDNHGKYPLRWMIYLKQDETGEMFPLRVSNDTISGRFVFVPRTDYPAIDML